MKAMVRRSGRGSSEKKVLEEMKGGGRRASRKFCLLSARLT
jgi:hypothetical protein